MDREKYYMNLPKDMAGSISKNRFRMELLWGISKMLDIHKEELDYTMIFDFKCDIELHLPNELKFYQIKTSISEHYTINELCKTTKTTKNNTGHSILGKLYALYNPNQTIKLAIVCNQQLKINNSFVNEPKKCFGELDLEIIDKIKKSIELELNIDSVNLDNVFYVFDNMDLLHPENAIKGKLIQSFYEIKKEEPENPNALYRLVIDTVMEKASYEFDSKTYEDVIKNKGITRNDFDFMLTQHMSSSKTGIQQTKDYINTYPLAKKRRYNKALAELLAVYNNKKLFDIRKNIFDFINIHEDEFENEESAIIKLKSEFDNKFDCMITKEMKEVLYLLIFTIYGLGGDI